MKKISSAIIVGIIILSASFVLFAHPGRTDSRGGHYNRSTGEYHYHNSGSVSAPKSISTPLPTTVKITPAPEPKKDIFDTISEQKKTVSVTENHWQVALNNNYFKGKMETVLSTGWADIENDTQVVEVDKVSKYLEGIEQVLRYAKATGKKPVLALYIDGEPNGFDLLKRAERLCYEKQVKLVLANCYVRTIDLISLIDIAESEKSKSLTLEETASKPKISKVDELTKPVQKEQIEMKYWITTSTGVRHNSSCRYYMNSKGRLCTKNEGRACKICGG